MEAGFTGSRRGYRSESVWIIIANAGVSGESPIFWKDRKYQWNSENKISKFSETLLWLKILLLPLMTVRVTTSVFIAAFKNY